MSRRKNNFTKAMSHLKSNRIDEKINQLEEQPTNNTMGLMTVGDPSHTVQPPDIEVTELDFDKGNDDDNGMDTSGIFNEEGVILTIEPDVGDTSYILGPMASMWYAWGNFSTFGYIRESDRKMVNLGTIVGKLSDWDQNQFNSYGQMTLEQAVWFYNTPKKDNAGNDPDNANYRAFYPGPPSTNQDAFGRYLCTITGTPKEFEKTPPPYVTSPTQGPESASDQFSGMLNQLWDRAKKFGQGLWDTASGLASNSLLKSALNIVRSLADPVQFAGDYMFKGLPKGVDYLPDFTGAAPKYLGGKKWADILPFGKQLAGSNYAGQYFTPSFETAINYATNVKTGEVGTVVVMPRTGGVRGWKNWLGSDVSRGFGTGNIEKFVRTSDTVANANLTKILDLSDPATKTALEALQASGSKSTAVLSRLGRIVPFLNAGLVAADVTSRVNDGDYFGAVLGFTQIIPGPIGWTALAAQVAYDVEGHFNKDGFKQGLLNDPKIYIPGKGQVKLPRGQHSEEYIMEQQEIDTEGLGQALIDMGLPREKDEFIKQMGLQFTLQGVNPEFLSIFLLSLAGKPLSPEQEKWVKDNVGKMAQAFASVGKKGKKKNVKESIQVLTESRRRILREIKKPYKVPKTPTKFKGIKPKVRVTGKGLMEVPEIPKQFKPEPTIWRKPNYDKNVKASQEKKNEVLEYVGAAADHWEYLTETRRKEKNSKRDAFYSTKKDRDFLYDYWYGGKKHKVTRKEDIDNDCLVYIEDEDGKKFSMLQSKLNEMLEEEKMKDMFDSYIPEEEQGEREKNFDKVTKLKSIVGKIKRGDIGPEYPNEPPPELVNGWHPKLGKKYKHDKLDPQSAEAMPDTGDPEIDANIKKATDAKSKARKLKTLLGKKA